MYNVLIKKYKNDISKYYLDSDKKNRYDGYNDDVFFIF